MVDCSQSRLEKPTGTREKQGLHRTSSESKYKKIKLEWPVPTRTEYTAPHFSKPNTQPPSPMQQILVYSDSLSWGIVPNTRQRLPFDARWPGVMERALRRDGRRIRVIENCLNGRCTTLDDPARTGRNGMIGLKECIEMHSPLALVILMLGTNDFQAIHERTARNAARAVGDLVEAIRLAPIEPGMPVPPVLIVVPPTIVAPAGTMADKFAGAEWKSKGLAQEYLQVAQDLGCPIFDANSVTSPSRIDGIHLDADQHESLGCALAAAARPFLDPSPQTK